MNKNDSQLLPTTTPSPVNQYLEKLNDTGICYFLSLFKDVSAFNPEVQNLVRTYKVVDSRKKNKIKKSLWETHHVLLYDLASRVGEPLPELVDFSAYPNNIFTENKRKELEIALLGKNKPSQISITLSNEEKSWITSAADTLGAQMSAFISQSSCLVAHYTMLCLSDDVTTSMGEIKEMLCTAHALRDTKLFTEDEILSLGLTPEQLRRFADLLESKQGGLPTVAEP